MLLLAHVELGHLRDAAVAREENGRTEGLLLRDRRIEASRELRLERRLRLRHLGGRRAELHAIDRLDERGLGAERDR